MRITSIERQSRRRRANIYVEGHFALSLDLNTLADSGLVSGDDVDQKRLDDLRQADTRRGAMRSALRLLAYRPRSEGEIRSRLSRKGVLPDVIEDTLEHLRTSAFLDDAAFAATWVERRNQTSPRGRRLLEMELRRHGIDQAPAREASEVVDENEAAYRAGQKRTRSLREDDPVRFQRRLSEYLQRRGFGYEVIKGVVKRLLDERKGIEADENEQ